MLRILRRLSPRVLFLALASAVVPLVLSAAPVDLGLPLAPSPEAAGFSGPRLTRIRTMLEDTVKAGTFAGVTWMVVHDGKVVTHGATGLSDLAAKRPLGESDVFHIMSMSKLITTVTALTFVEEGKINLDDPVSLYFPELGTPQVFTGGTAEAPTLVPADRPVTIRMLLTQTSGYSYGIFDSGGMREIYQRANLWTAPTLPEFIHRAAKLPLHQQPGAGWTYGINTDILGAIVEKVAGKPLGEVMTERVLAPLGMIDTGFTPPVDASRVAKIYQSSGLGKLAEIPVPLMPAFESGGGGLYSTMHDYARFAQMLLNGGSLGEVRILGRKTVEMMTHTQIGYLNPRPISRFFPQGFGFGVRVQLEDPSEQLSLGSPGRYGWEGLLSTLVSIDPKEHLILIAMLQHQPYDEHEIFERYTNTVYQALER